MSIQDYLEGKDPSKNQRTDAIVRALREEILSGVLQPGDRLTEKEVSERFRTSRTPVREALTRLEECGLCQMIPNRGASVLELSEQHIRDLFEMQSQLELLAIPWAIERITDQELKELSEVFDFMVFYTRTMDTQKMLPINYAFYRILFKATHDRFLEKQLTEWQQIIRHSFPMEYDNPLNLQALLEEHEELFRAVLEGDRVAGQEAMKKHIEASRKRKFPEV